MGKAVAPKDKGDKPETAEQPTVNLAVVLGPCSSAPDIRELESGRRIASISVRAHGTGPQATSVPVTVWDPPAWIEELEEGDPVVVVGCVRRRFFQSAAGFRGAKSEVEAKLIGRAHDRRKLAAVLRHADRELELLT
jgi:single-strand DNA-binding protein